MLFPEGQQTDTEAIGKQTISTTQPQSEQQLDREQIFHLIETVVPFKACLYYQILPFRLEDNNLLLGMVNPQDSAALDYISRILSSMNYIMVTQLITADVHRRLLSDYLNYKNSLVSSTKQATQSKETLTQESNITAADSASTEQPTLILAQTQPVADQLEEVNKYQEQRLQQEDKEISPPTSSSLKQESTDDATPSLRDITALQLPTPERFSPIEVLTTLPPKKLLEELLGRVLAGGIGRLYLERRPYDGRILWSENGVLQSVLDKLPLFVFQGVLNELKRFASLPITTFTEPKQVEKECLYQKNRLLLRLRIMPGLCGEEATLQVLRGAALKFYQQQQLTRLSRDALGISQQLSYKLHELQERLLLSQDRNPERLEVFNALNQLLDNLDQQIKVIIMTSDHLKN
jgi:type II secretory ATPase GspE/PulE/Tfp pilus assembly ATPase PilB-like protein